MGRESTPIDIPVDNDESKEVLPEAYKIVLLGDRAVGKSRYNPA